MAEIRESSVGANKQSLRVDRKRGVLFDVCLLREQGNCEYPEATRRRAVGLLEGKRAYVDHAPKGSRNPERRYRDALGVFTGVYERGDSDTSDSAAEEALRRRVGSLRVR